jgi:hypothetical protein
MIIENIQPKQRTWRGQIMTPSTTDIYNAEINKNELIRLYGTYKNAMKPINFDITFKIGDSAIYDSYNFSYVGKIIAIGEKTVTIDENPGMNYSRNRRLDLYEFCWRNWDFNAERIRKEISEWSD